MRLPFSDPWSPVEIHQRFDASREEVFSLVADPRTYPEWLIGAQRIRDVDEEFPAPGTKFEAEVGPTESATVDDTTKVIAAHGHRKLVMQLHVGPLTGEVEFDLRKRSNNQTEVVMLERPTGPALLLTPLLRPVLALRNQRSMRKLDQLVRRNAA